MRSAAVQRESVQAHALRDNAILLHAGTPAEILRITGGAQQAAAGHAQCIGGECWSQGSAGRL